MLLLLLLLLLLRLLLLYTAAAAAAAAEAATAAHSTRSATMFAFSFTDVAGGTPYNTASSFDARK